jgi:hypothetical protein
MRYIKRKVHKRAAKCKEETPIDKAARRTATATVWMAVFTCLLLLVTAGTYIEIKTGSADTHDLAVAAGKQADRTKDLADRMKEQADGTKVIADQAIIQAQVARSAANTASESLRDVQRAFLVLKEIDAQRINSALPKGGSRREWRTFIDWENTGVTPATGIINHFDACTLPQEPSESLFKEGPVDASYLITYAGPKSLLSGGPINRPESFIPVGPMPMPRERPTFWGWAFYRDIFKVSHVTEFCEVVSNVGTRPDGTAILQYSNCAEHNCTDHDCKDFDEIVKMVGERADKRPQVKYPTPN